MEFSLSPQESKPRCEFVTPSGMCLEMDLQQQRKWLDLPSLVFSAIMEKLTWEQDYVRFGATCVPWRTAFLQGNAKNLSSLPFLLLPPPPTSSQQNQKPKSSKPKNTSFEIIAHRPERKRKRKFESNNDKTDQDWRSLYSISRNNVCDFQVKVPRNRYCVASSLGWLLTMKPKEYNKYGVREVKYYLQLQNPFLPDADVIHLPQLPLPTVPLPDLPSMYVAKAVLSSPPDTNLNKNFVLMTISSRDYNLAFFNPATKHFCWTPVAQNYKQMAFSDVIYFNKTQQFYAVRKESGQVYAIDTDIVEKHPKLTLVAPATDRLETFLKRYIVELPSGDLLQVIKLPDLSGNATRLTWNATFEVWKFDSDIGGWIQIHDIGDAMLFIGCNSYISRYASDYPNCKPNCIYFTNEYVRYSGIRCEHHEDSGIYNLADGSVQPHYSMSSNRSIMAPIWLEPTPKK